MNLRQRAAGRRVAGAVRRFAARRAMARYRRFRRKVYSTAMTANPMPSFTETFKSAKILTIAPGGSLGTTFSVRITDIPQVNQYANLYKQYRINWVKVMMILKLDTSAADPNAAIYNGLVVPTQWFGNARIVYAINNSPNVQAPASEQEVLEDNGAKIKSFKSKWSCSFKPVPNVYQGTTDATGAPTEVFTRQKFRQWFNFETTLTGKNPEHGYVSAYITIPGNVPGGADPFNQIYYIYYKVNFTLRDPQ